MSDNTRAMTTQAGVLGAGGGTVLASLVSILATGSMKDVLLILAPSISVLFGGIYLYVNSLINRSISNRIIVEERKGVERLLQQMEQDNNASTEMKAKVRQEIDTLRLLEIQVRKDRVHAVIKNT